MTMPDFPRPRLLLFPASLRRLSHQRRLAAYFAARLGGACDIDMLAAGQVDLPLFNQDLESEPAVHERVVALHRRFKAAAGLIVVSPEYNGHVSPYLKNTVDWVSRLPRIDPRYAADNPFRGKPLLLASASTGWAGGLLGLKDARSVFGYLGALVVPDQICVSDAEQWADGEDFRFDPAFADHIDGVLRAFCALAGRLARPAAAAAEEAMA